MIYRRLFGSLLAAMVMVLTACAGGGGGTEVQVTLSDFKVESSASTFSTSTPYRFAIQNKGATSHTWDVIPQGQPDHTKALMMVSEDKLPAGGKFIQEFTFTKAGTYELACLVPDHYEAGMGLKITVQ